MKDSGNILVLGAGPAGMATAIELHKAKKKFVLVEKDFNVGGLSKTYKFGKFYTDNGPHRFFSKNKFLYEFIEDLLGQDWIKVNRCTRQFIDGKFYDYPINAVQAFRNIGFSKTSRMLFDYAIATYQYKIKKKKIRNFEDYIVANFGRTLGEFNMLNYTRKQYGFDCSQLHSDWAKQRIKGLNFREALMNAIKKSFNFKSTDTPKTLVDQFYYPSKGTGLIYDRIKERIEKENQILLNTWPVKIKSIRNKIVSVELNNGKIIRINKLVSSIHVDTFLSLLDPKPPNEIIKAVNKLRYRSEIFLFLTINKNRVTKDQWIYFPEENVPLFRMSEMKNFSKYMSPKGKTSLLVEYFCWKDDEIWNKSKKDLTNLTVENLEKMGFIKKKDVIHSYLIKQEKTYPVYDVNYKRYLKIVSKYLDKYKNLIYIGRPGRFKYTNQDHSLEMGFLAARSIIENRRINVEDVGSEKEYFESGYSK